MPTTSSIIKEFGLPLGLVSKEDDAWGLQPDEETTDNGSSLSDNEASSTSESLSHEVHPALCSFLAPPVASRRCALQQMGQKVLGNISSRPVVRPNAGRIGQNADVSGQKACRVGPPGKLVNKGKGSLPAKAVSGLQQCTSSLTHNVQGKGSGTESTANASSGPKPCTSSLAMQPAAASVPTPELLMQRAQFQAPSRQRRGELKPLKVENCDSFDLNSMMPPPLDPKLPAKKRPIFEDGRLPRDFNPNCPLKKRVPEYLLQDPVSILT